MPSSVTILRLYPLHAMAYNKQLRAVSFNADQALFDLKSSMHQELAMYRTLSLWLALTFSVSISHAHEPTIRIDAPMLPPTWALLERELLRAHTDACREFFQKYFDDRGYLLCVERWGGDDGPDDAMENVADWPLLHALGGSDEILAMYKKAWEGHLRQYTLAKTTDVPFARDGMYYKEFPVTMDWMHNGEGLRVFNLQGLSDPSDREFTRRVRRFAGFYLNEDPGAPNYDPQHKIIRSLFNGSRGPLLRKATAVDWAGDPIEVEHRFLPRHGEKSYQEMLEHFQDYNEIIGDHPQNLSATTLVLNAYLVTGAPKYKKWLVDYLDAWATRMEANGGIIPSNIGLDGKIGSATNGKWYGGVYGWGFSVKVPRTGELAHRNNVGRGIIGFGNALMLTGDRRYIQGWARMIDLINAQRRTIDGTVQYPRMYGDQGWYAYSTSPWSEGALECYFWSCDPQDRARVPKNAWLDFLEKRNPDYPTTALQNDFVAMRRKVADMREDPTTPDTRLSDDPMEFNPAVVQSLNQLMMGGLNPGRGGGPLHCRVRWFDLDRRRAGVPEDVAVLIDEMTDDHVGLTLVNLSPTATRTPVAQCGAYAEHHITHVVTASERREVNGSFVTFRLAPGAGARINVYTRRFAGQPTMSFPWQRSK